MKLKMNEKIWWFDRNHFWPMARHQNVIIIYYCSVSCVSWRMVFSQWTLLESFRRQLMLCYIHKNGWEHRKTFVRLSFGRIEKMIIYCKSFGLGPGERLPFAYVPCLYRLFGCPLRLLRSFVLTDASWVDPMEPRRSKTMTIELTDQQQQQQQNNPRERKRIAVWRTQNL